MASAGTRSSSATSPASVSVAQGPALAAGRLDALSPLGTLRRGYAVPLSDDGTVLRHGDMFTIGGRFALRVIDAHVDCRVEGISNAKAGGGES